MKELNVILPDKSEIKAAAGTDFYTLLKEHEMLGSGDETVTAVLVNNELQSLASALITDSELTPVLIKSNSGARVYRKTLTALVSMVCEQLYPDKRLIVGHSLSTGYFCYFDNETQVTEKQLLDIEREMNRLIEQNLNIIPELMNYQVAEKLFSGNESKRLLLKYKNDAVLPVIRIGDWVDLSFEPLMPLTGMLTTFEIMSNQPGFVLRFPHAGAPGCIDTFEDNPLLRDIYTEYKAWGKILNVDSAGKLNSIAGTKDVQQFIWVAEALHEKKLSQIADQINEKREDLRVVLIAGPSSSGKTTFTKKLAIHLKVLGFNPLLISLDDYYVPREQTPRDENGDYDFEALEAIDIKLLNDDLLSLFAGKETEIPTFNFKTGEREYKDHKIQMEHRNILLIEGIHGLNDRLTERIPARQKFKIYISALTQLNIDDNNRIATTDNRLLRRIVRDSQFRGYDALKTLGMWGSVRRGEKKNIFPFQNNADAVFNSALDYELPVLKNLAIPVLKAVKPMNREYAEAVRLISFLDNFITIQPKYVPMNSILREFIGDSGFKY